jgi:hypothetical protein
MKQRGEAILITLVVIFVIGGLSAVSGYLFAPACQYQPPPQQQSIGGVDVLPTHIPGK